MAEHKSAIRQWRRSIRRTAINKKNKTGMRTQVKNLRALISDKKKDEAVKLLPRVMSDIDKTAKKGAIHKGKADRLKSRLSRQVAQVNVAPTK